jgi:monomeric isocitrate dehydrogenase
VEVIDATGKEYWHLKVEAGDIWRMCQMPDSRLD